MRRVFFFNKKNVVKDKQEFNMKVNGKYKPFEPVPAFNRT